MSELFPVAILAGGVATRLRPITENLPKSLIEIDGEPFIAHQLRLLKKNHISRVILCLGFLGEQIQEFVGDGAQFGLQVEYVFDGCKLLGTGGAIKRALPFLGEAFFVLYGDSYLTCNYLTIQNVFKQQHKQALMTVFKNKGLWDASNIEYREGNIIAYNKKNRTDSMHYIDYGLSIMTPPAFQLIACDSAQDLAQIYQVLLESNQLGAYEIHQRFYEIGSFSGIDELSHHLLQEKISANESISGIISCNS